MGWGMWHAWEINVYIVWWEHLKERDYLGNLCVDRQIILKLIWKSKGDGVCGEGAFWGGCIWREEVVVNTRHSHHQYYIQLNSQLYAPAALHHGKKPLVFIGWPTPPLVMNMADLVSAD